MTGVFAEWQPVYAEHNIPTFPCRPDKRPAVTNYGRFGLPASKQIANSSGADAFGFMCGKRSASRCSKWNSTDERGFADALDRHGHTQIIVRSGSGHLQAWYRHAGEGRKIRLRPDVPLDILGGGYVVAPPSRVERGQYQFLQGSLDDLPSLPTLLDAPSVIPPDCPSDWGSMREGDGRNNKLFKLGLRAVKVCDDFDQLLDWGQTQNRFCAEPMSDKEVAGIMQNVWRYESNGLNRVGRFGAYFPIEEIDKLVSEPDDLCLLAFLRAYNHFDSTFMVANGLAGRFGWWRQRLAASRRRLIESGHLIRIRQAGKNAPALYQWSERRGRG